MDSETVLHILFGAVVLVMIYNIIIKGKRQKQRRKHQPVETTESEARQFLIDFKAAAAVFESMEELREFEKAGNDIEYFKLFPFFDQEYKQIRAGAIKILT